LEWEIQTALAFLLTSGSFGIRYDHMVINMNKQKLFENQAVFLKALGQPTRLQILDLLKNGERCVCEIFPAINQEQANVSKHLTILKQSGILESRKEGLRVTYWIKNKEVLDLIKGVSLMLKNQAQEQREILSHL
jgi:DNA-binding transcriptional ArsR family regulator